MHTYIARNLAIRVSFKARFTVIIVVVIERQQPNGPPSDLHIKYLWILVNTYVHSSKFESEVSTPHHDRLVQIILKLNL